MGGLSDVDKGYLEQTIDNQISQIPDLSLLLFLTAWIVNLIEITQKIEELGKILQQKNLLTRVIQTQY